MAVGVAHIYILVWTVVVRSICVRAPSLLRLGVSSVVSSTLKMNSVTVFLDLVYYFSESSLFD